MLKAQSTKKESWLLDVSAILSDCSSLNFTRAICMTTELTTILDEDR
jgi:hypothetical protein